MSEPIIASIQADITAFHSALEQVRTSEILADLASSFHDLAEAARNLDPAMTDLGHDMPRTGTLTLCFHDDEDCMPETLYSRDIDDDELTIDEAWAALKQIKQQRRME